MDIFEHFMNVDFRGEKSPYPVNQKQLETKALLYVVVDSEGPWSQRG